MNVLQYLQVGRYLKFKNLFYIFTFITENVKFKSMYTFVRSQKTFAKQEIQCYNSAIGFKLVAYDCFFNLQKLNLLFDSTHRFIYINVSNLINIHQIEAFNFFVLVNWFEIGWKFQVKYEFAFYFDSIRTSGSIGYRIHRFYSFCKFRSNTSFLLKFLFSTF